jgi:hypothetical protein
LGLIAQGFLPLTIYSSPLSAGHWTLPLGITITLEVVDELVALLDVAEEVGEELEELEVLLLVTVELEPAVLLNVGLDVVKLDVVKLDVVKLDVVKLDVVKLEVGLDVRLAV